jgi:pyruvate dehydrogenase E1 component alpha subunit
MAASKTPQSRAAPPGKPPVAPPPTTPPPGSGPAGPTEAVERPRAPRLPPQIRAGMGDVTAELIEIYSDEDLRKATGWVSILPGGSNRGDGDALEAGRLRRTLHDVGPDVWRDIYRGMLRIHRLDLHLTAAAAATGRLGDAPEADLDAAASHDHGHDLGGLEAAAVAPLAALAATDWVVPGNRESAAALYRGLPIRDYLANVLGNAHDRAKGRQAPGHPVTARALRVLPASSSGSTQLPQAAGIAWAAKIERDDTVVLCFLDADATAAEDFHTGLNFAAVFKVPVVFLCVNTRDDGHIGPAGAPVEPGAGVGLGSETVALKALAYGLPGIRVDGSDALAVFQVVRGAVQAARAGGGPTLIEAVAARRRTRPNGANAEALGGASDPGHPMQRLARWLRDSSILDAGAEALWTAEIDAEIRDALAFEMGVPGPSVDTLIEDVYLTPPSALTEQLAELVRVRARNG